MFSFLLDPNLWVGLLGLWAVCVCGWLKETESFFLPAMYDYSTFSILLSTFDYVSVFPLSWSWLVMLIECCSICFLAIYISKIVKCLLKSFFFSCKICCWSFCYCRILSFLDTNQPYCEYINVTIFWALWFASSF